MCYSGCCLFSSLNGGRSGNRGECVGSCRLPYKLVKNNEVLKVEGDYILSTKEINTLDHIKELMESDITSFKIEGRMKSPSYVGYVTRMFRILIDKYYKNEELKLSNEEILNLKKLFNRDFSDGYLFNSRDVMNIKTPNHQGIEIGRVIDSNKDKIKIKLTDDLNQNDGIRFKSIDKGMIVNRLYNTSNLLVNSISKGNICILDNKFNVRNADIVLKTIDSKLISSLEHIEEKRIEIDMKVKCFIGTKIELTITDGINNVTSIGDIVESAINREISNEDIIKQLSKLGNTPFKLRNIDIVKDDNIFINLKALNEIRRDAVDKLITLRENRDIKVIKNTYIEDTKKIDKTKDISLNVLVRNEEQLLVCLNNNINDIFITDYELY